MGATHHLLAGPAPAGTATAARDVAVTLHDVRKSYGARTVLRGVSLQIRAGEVFGLLGPNGAGKTTLVECLVGLRRPDAGSITVLGMDPLRQRHEFTTRVSVQPQDASLFENIRSREALELFASFHADPLPTQEVLDQIGLAEDDRQLVRKLSGGQRRRLLLGVAMIGAPDLIVLDEPSAGLDPQARRGLWAVIDRLRTAGTTVLLTTHHMDEAAALCDRVAFLVDGAFAAVGTPAHLVATLSGSRTVSFELHHGDPEAARTELAALPVVRTVELGPGRPARIVVHTDDTDEVLAHLGRTDAFTARAITLEQGDLENVFLTLSTGATSTQSPPPQGRRRSRRNRKEPQG